MKSVTILCLLFLSQTVESQSRNEFFYENPLIGKSGLWDKLDADRIAQIFGPIDKVDRKDALQFYFYGGKLKVIEREGSLLTVELDVYPAIFNQLQMNLSEDTSLLELVHLFGNYSNASNENGGPAKQDLAHWNEYVWQFPREERGFVFRIQNRKIVMVSLGRDFE